MSNNAQNMQIFTIIGQLEELVESSPRPKIGGSANKRIVGADEILDLIGDLKVTIPEDIRRANSVIIESQTMIDNAGEHAKDIVSRAQMDSDALIAKANATAQSIQAKAQMEYERLISEDEIYREAQRRAKLLALKAEANAGMVFENAKKYADDILRDLENFLAEYKQLVAINRRDLDVHAEDIQPGTQPTLMAQPAAPLQQRQAAPVRAAAPVPENGFDDDYDDGDEDERESGSIFSRLFGRKKKADEMEFDDDEE